VTLAEIEEAVRAGNKTTEDVSGRTGAGSQCCSCHPDLEVIIPALLSKIKKEEQADQAGQLGLF